ncbi:ATP-binding protein [Marinomonas pontica]|uniref:sensor histidine kinase n=1 Tax=Marinomonas pontica TaxID=264739 RepID=UPI002244783F|nr:sensor histidine kinase [Marinomonas pontica]MCW8354610.1 ATP-binding protein [Marinomonas pontica]
MEGVKMVKPRGFRIAARALRQLGAELITSDEIALNELIKNALDAGSKRVRIDINNPFKLSRTNLVTKLISSTKQLTKSEILEVIEDCIDENSPPLFLSDYVSRIEFSDPKKISSLVDEMYNDLCSITISDNGVGMGEEQLQNSFLVIGTPSKWIDKQSDTDSELLGEKGVGRLSMMRLGRYASVSSGKAESKYNHEINFDWSLFDDPNLYLDEVDVPVTKGQSKIAEEQGTSILVKGIYAHWNRAKVSSFINEYLRRLQNPFSERNRFPIDVYFNGTRQPIERIYSWFKKAANFSALIQFTVEKTGELSLRRELTWRGKTSPEMRLWTEKDLLRELGNNDQSNFHSALVKKTLTELGSIKLDLLWFNRSDLNGASIDYSSSQIREELNLWCGGYAIYRDNFRIGMTGSLEDDWLKVDTGSLKSKGFSFNRYQTVGALSITQKNNPLLLDAANREKLINCNHLDLLKDMLTELVNKDLKSHIEYFKNNEVKKASSEATAQETLEDAKARLKRARESATSLRKSVGKEQQLVVKEIEHVLKSQYENIRKYEHAMLLSKEQRIEVLELAGLGMVVDKVVHELARLTEQTTISLLKLEKQGQNEDSSHLIKVIREQIKVTNKRIRTVDSLSPSGRNRKELFDLTKAVLAVIDGFSGRLSRHNAEILFTVDDQLTIRSFNVEMVLGLAALVLENLLANSIYWLQQGLFRGENKRKIYINIDTQSYTLSVRDNGPGIDPSNKDDIFRAYFTSRPKGKGLGLFICREIADYHQCSIYLDTMPEADGRLRTFVLELPKKN